MAVRFTDGRGKQLPKVFIVYPHNPQVYVWSPPPSEEEVQRMYPGAPQHQVDQIRINEMKRREDEVQVRISSHDELVHKFAQFLHSHRIAVSYEGLLVDHPISNYMKWFQSEMEDSDYIILIITESFNHFLSHEPPEGKERIFTGNFLHNLVNNPRKPLLPVFLNLQTNLDLLPDALRGSSTYEVVASEDAPHFDVQVPQLDRLYAFLTRQDRLKAPPPVQIIPNLPNLRDRRRDGPLGSGQHQTWYTTLRQMTRVVTRKDALQLSQKPEISVHWRTLASYFNLSPSQVEHIGYHHSDAERCYKLLIGWMEMGGNMATVSMLVEGLRQNTVMLEAAYGVLNNN